MKDLAHQREVVLQFAGKVIRGELRNALDLSKAIAFMAADLVDVDGLREHLTEEAQRRADRLVDTIEDLKVRE